MIRFRFLVFIFNLLCVSSIAMAQWNSNSSVSTQQSGMSKVVWESDNGRVWCGYCSPDYVIRKLDGVGFSSIKDINVTAAIRFSEGMLGTLRGRKIYTVKIGVTQDVADINLFIRKSDNTVLWKKTVELKFGWNDIPLEIPLEIPAVDELYLGYSYTQVYHDIPVENPYIAGATESSKLNGLFLAKEGEPLTEYIDQGSLCLLAEVDGAEEDFDYVGSLREVSSPYPYSFKELNKPADIHLAYLNEGGGFVSRITLGRTFNGVELSDTVYAFGKIIKPNEIGRLTLKANPAESGEYSFFLKKIESASVPASSPKAVKISMSENKECIPRMALIEEFTSQNCGNCPAGQIKIHEEIGDQEDRVAMVLHHAGFDYDIFSAGESQSYCYFYNSKELYAPAVMMNRTYIPEFNTKAFKTPVFEPSYFSGDRLSQEINLPACVSVDIRSSYDEVTRKLVVVVSGHRVADLIGEHLGLNVYLLESHFVTWQNDLNGGNDAFEHNNFLRGVLSEIEGDAIVFNADGTYSKSYDFTIPEKYVTPKDVSTKIHPENMHIVAFVGNYDPERPYECVVLNANKTASLNGATGINPVIKSTETLPAYVKNGTVCIDGEYESFKLCNLQGMAVRNEGLTPGVYILKVMCSDHVECTQKILVH